MIANILIGGAIFGYAGWAFYRFIKKSKEGKCAACSIQSSCSTSCSVTQEKKTK
ncbi:FeoB-associated Cys-rich membrane protein [Bacillus sp. ISL-41]|uniref:FeoB-associated Cys-rich membrane protein n=1 Tax=Bacillus sp. ISL-41 TaxID=2819127 RepID=UPI001BE74138|nr:FeoB-associated Cys-rich membrane protein [Bacillus sp. ISL-41]MBT2644810.1 FeoB-associated Cys-rich membrane protein [Bacillus sp. ISL-41]